MPEETGGGAAAAPDVSGVERSFLGRPSFGIRARLILSFLSFVVFAVAVTIGAWILLGRLERRLRFLEAGDRYTMEIQQTRRFEKNYFLYGTNLSDVQDHLGERAATSHGRRAGRHASSDRGPSSRACGPTWTATSR